MDTLKPDMQSLSVPVSSRTDKERERLKKREADNDFRKLYHQKRWRDLRLKILERDLFTCRQTGVLLSGKHPAPNSPVVDHIKPHRGDIALFWDENNLQSVSKAWHDSIKQAREKADQNAARRPDWLRPSKIPLHIVCGPPCAGKSYLVNQRRKENDIVIDLDEIAAEISGETSHGWSAHWLNAALWRRNEMLGDLSRMQDDGRSAWFIVSEPSAKNRQWWIDQLKPVAVYVLETSESECIKRCADDTRRDQKQTTDAIVKWWWLYDKRRGDIVIV